MALFNWSSRIVVAHIFHLKKIVIGMVPLTVTGMWFLLIKWLVVLDHSEPKIRLYKRLSRIYFVFMKIYGLSLLVVLCLDIIIWDFRIFRTFYSDSNNFEAPSCCYILTTRIQQEFSRIYYFLIYLVLFWQYIREISKITIVSNREIQVRTKFITVCIAGRIPPLFNSFGISFKNRLINVRYLNEFTVCIRVQWDGVHVRVKIDDLNFCDNSIIIAFLNSKLFYGLYFCRFLLILYCLYIYGCRWNSPSHLTRCLPNINFILQE